MKQQASTLTFLVWIHYPCSSSFLPLTLIHLSTLFSYSKPFIPSLRTVWLFHLLTIIFSFKRTILNLTFLFLCRFLYVSLCLLQHTEIQYNMKKSWVVRQEMKWLTATRCCWVWRAVSTLLHCRLGFRFINFTADFLEHFLM